jgi:4-hydroxy-tetrahydrodipicolinate synthase
VITQARGRVPVLIGAGAENPVAVVRYATEAAELGADGVLIIPPFYSAPNEEEVFAHYAYIAERISIPMMVYNNPAITNIDLMPPLIARLATLPNVRYVKESTLDVTRVRDIVRLVGPDFGVFGGILGYESFLNGAVGWTAVGANILPAEFAALYHLTAVERDIDAARALYARLLPLIELVGGPRYVSATKTLLTQLGWPVGPPRLPRLPSAAEERLWVECVRAEMQLVAR